MPAAPDVNALYRIATDWLARRNGAGWSEADAREFDAWLRADPSHEAAYRRIAAAQGGLGSGAVSGGAGTPQAGRPPRQRRLGAWLVGGFLVLGLLLMAALTVSYVLRETSPRYQGSAAAAPGQTRSMSLPDGSVVTLGGGTEISAMYYARRREFVMSPGAAMFRVSYLQRAGFTVRVGAEEITVDPSRIPVPDTAFDVQAGADRLVVRVGQGKAKVYTATAGAREFVELAAGDVVTVHPKARRHELGKVDPAAVGGVAFQK